jgi:hypothetical protein
MIKNVYWGNFFDSGRIEGKKCPKIGEFLFLTKKGTVSRSILFFLAA